METTAPNPGDNGNLNPGVVDPVNTGVQTGTNPGSNNHNWLGQVDDLTVGYVQNKGWQNPNELLTSYQNLEKLFGADRAGNTVTIPKAEADATEWGSFYDRLGRPSDPKGYGIGVPEGVDPTFTNDATAKFHELGLSKTQAAQLTEWWLGYAGNIEATAKEADAAKFQAEEADLRKSWGQAYDQNVNVARNVAKALDLDAPTVDKLQSVLGHKGVMELLTKIGAKNGEADFVTSSNQQFGNVLTPQQAKAEIAQLLQDKNFVDRYMNKDQEALKKMANLHTMAYPE